MARGGVVRRRSPPPPGGRAVSWEPAGPPFWADDGPRAVELVRAFRGLRALVVGDAMLDSYLEGTATRLCKISSYDIARMRSAWACRCAFATASRPTPTRWISACRRMY